MNTTDNINDLLFANYHGFSSYQRQPHISSWEPVDIAKDISCLSSHKRYCFISFTKGEEAFYLSKESRIFLGKEINSQNQLMGIVATLRKLGLNFVAQIEGDSYYGHQASELDLNKYKMNKIYLRPEDYTSIAAKVHNVFVNAGSEEIQEGAYKKVMAWHSLLHGLMSSKDIQKISINYIAMLIKRPLKAEEEKAFEAPEGQDFQDLYLKRLVLGKNNWVFNNISEHEWKPKKILIDELGYHEGNIRYFHYDGVKIKEIETKDLELNTFFVSKGTYRRGFAYSDAEKPAKALMAHHIPYIVCRQSGYDTAIYVLPQDYEKLISLGIQNSFDLLKPIIEKLDEGIVWKMIEEFPAAEESVMSQKTWLHMFWNALEIEHNRPLSLEEKQRLIPAKSSTEAMIINLRRAIDSCCNEILEKTQKMSEMIKQSQELFQKDSHAQEISTCQMTIAEILQEIDKKRAFMQEAHRKLVILRSSS
ncbi:MULTISPECIES: hypothetical protein [Parachlamydia]|jgi:hypothetical protein|uniref:Uncharacterized protein n=2 Tax=Parachlamydia acanthamoebae TaxID=83552 RepID=F8KZA6_PARAV|nr:hypothetical protein [Parachlamydia acanthamoebae]EFB41880.1 hypothetical protein pah_c022o184 [Parachlamydia acanthamoebae str. Hall's coccus]KIA78018.1 hypothetical protein DB43_FD00070 [Parachlamydia acanthamoebae]CCB86240.1 putative uncharacterized protein [Parachlamydia acanthamoebae UV-7]